MKKTSLFIVLILALLSSTLKVTAQSENPEEIANRTEAKTLYTNFKTMYNTVEFDENGGSISLANLQALLNQMQANHSTNIVYMFGRTAPDKTGKNIIMFFNSGYSVDQLDKISKFKAVNLCPTDCNQNVSDYLK